MSKRYKVTRIKKNVSEVTTASVAGLGADGNPAVSIDKLKKAREKNYEPMPVLKRQES